MALPEQEQFLRDRGWAWLLDALAFGRDRMSAEENQSQHKDAIARSKHDDYAQTVNAIVDHVTKISN